MDINSIYAVIFKSAFILLSIIYVLFSVVVSRQVKIMTQTLEDKFNWLIILISSIQTSMSLILLIFAVFLT